MAALILALDSNRAVTKLRHFGRMHPRENDAYLAVQPRRPLVALVEARIRRHGREARTLLGRKPRGRRPEVALRRGLGPEHAAAPLDHVQIELEDALLVEDRLEHQRDHRLLALAQVAARRGQEEILRELLRDRRAAGDDASPALVLLQRALDAVPVEALVI